MTSKYIFDRQEIIRLLKEQEPDIPELVEAMQNAGEGWWGEDGTYYFVSPTRANKCFSPWQYKESIDLIHPEYGLILVDVLKSGKVGAIDFAAGVVR